ncbi:hypothetical protein P4S72_26765 [Vibrio sp. PP-XX7]
MLFFKILEMMSGVRKEKRNTVVPIIPNAVPERFSPACIAASAKPMPCQELLDIPIATKIIIDKNVLFVVMTSSKHNIEQIVAILMIVFILLLLISVDFPK